MRVSKQFIVETLEEEHQLLTSFVIAIELIHKFPIKLILDEKLTVQ